MSFLDEAAVASASVVAITEVEVYSLHESFASIFYIYINIITLY